MHPVHLFAAIFIIAGVAGLNYLLRSNKKLTLRSVSSSFLHGGLSGMVVACLWYERVGETRLWFLMGVSVLCGLAGPQVFDVILVGLLKRFGLLVSTEEPSEVPRPKNPLSPAEPSK